MPDQSWIQIRVTAKDDLVVAPEFFQVSRYAIETIDRLERSSAENHRTSSDWRIVGASANSPVLLTLANYAAQAGGQGRALFMSGLQQLESEIAIEAPPFFDVPTLRTAQRMLAVLNRNVAAVTFSDSGLAAVTCTEKSQENIDRLLRAKYEDTGALEGILDAPRAHNRRRFNLYDPLTDLRVACQYKLDDIEEIRAAWMGRVAVYGQIRYDKHGQPISMTVERIRRLRGEPLRIADLPPLDITGGVESSEYVRRLRDAD